LSRESFLEWVGKDPAGLAGINQPSGSDRGSVVFAKGGFEHATKEDKRSCRKGRIGNSEESPAEAASQASVEP
jgi:hypothetical protein